MFRNPIAHLAALLALATAPCFAQSNWAVVRTFHIGGEGASWDYVTMDTANHRLFVTRATHTQAIDTATGKVLGDIAGQVRSHGVALVPKLNRGFITDGGGTGAIVIFDLKTYAILGKLAAMPDADGIIYDAKLDKVLFVSGDGNSMTAFDPSIDPQSGKLPEPIKLGGAPEFLASDGSKVFVNIEDSPRARSSRAGRSRLPASPSEWPLILLATSSSSAAAVRKSSSS
jgi:hypothetical protein